MNILEKLNFTKTIIEDITKYVEEVGGVYAGKIDIETFENTVYIICDDFIRYDLETIFTGNVNFIMRDNGNERTKFMITIGYE